MIDELLSPARIESLPPEPGGSEVAWDEVIRRRGRRVLRAQVAAGVGLVLIVMVGLLPSLDDGGRAAELDVAGDPSGQRATSDAPSLMDEQPEAPEDVSGEGGSVGPRSSGRAPGTSAASPAVIESRPSAPVPAAGRPKPAMRRTQQESFYIGCIEWCLQPQVLKEGDRYALRMDLCVAVGGRARRFSYATVQEVDMWVATNEQQPQTLWTWSLGQQFPTSEHHLDISPGQCVMWQTLWDATDERGEPLEPGNYRLFAKSLAEQTAPNSVTETTFQISE